MLPLPGLGELPVNAFLLDGAEPILVDAGLGMLGREFVEALSVRLDPASLRWIWISHVDADHVGNLSAVLAAAPRAQLITSFLGRGRMMLQGLPFPPERVRLLEAGQSLETADRRLQALRSPYYDAPETLGLFESESAALFVADAFGAALPHGAEAAEDLDCAVLRQGMASWSGLDAPWLAGLDARVLRAALDALEQRGPRRVLSAHLPPARDITALTGIVADLHAGARVPDAA